MVWWGSLLANSVWWFCAVFGLSHMVLAPTDTSFAAIFGNLVKFWSVWNKFGAMNIWAVLIWCLMDGLKHCLVICNFWCNFGCFNHWVVWFLAVFADFLLLWFRYLCFCGHWSCLMLYEKQVLFCSSLRAVEFCFLVVWMTAWWLFMLGKFDLVFLWHSFGVGQHNLILFCCNLGAVWKCFLEFFFCF